MTDEQIKKELEIAVNDGYKAGFKAGMQHYAHLMVCAAMADKLPKNIVRSQRDKDAYKKMCIQLAQGYELEFLCYPTLIRNEFGEAEYIQAFKHRHPNFDKDIKQALL